jgi:cobalt/nickel transport system permease protein
MLEETFANGNSLVHRLDPRVKAFFALVFSVMAAVADRFPALILALVMAVVLVAMARLSARAVAYRIGVVNGFVLLLWLMLPFTYPGASLFHIGPLAVSREGTLFALLITVKSNAIILACIALLSTTHLMELGRALGRLRVPDKIIHVLLFMLRYLGVIDREYLRLRASMKVRCFQPRTNLRTYRTYANMVGMLLINSYERAEAIYAAMLCRGFKGKFYATEDFAMSGIDLVFGAAMAAILLSIGLLQWT